MLHYNQHRPVTVIKTVIGLEYSSINGQRKLFNEQERREKMEKKKKKYVFIGGMVILIILISGYGMVAAWGPFGKLGRGFDHGFHGRGFHDSDMAEFFLWKMDEKVKDLGLSDAQQEKYHKFRSEIGDHFARTASVRSTMMEQFHSEMAKDDPDIRLLTESLKDRIEELSGFAERTLDLFGDFYETLDAGQRGKILSAVRERMENRYH